MTIFLLCAAVIFIPNKIYIGSILSKAQLLKGVGGLISKETVMLRLYVAKWKTEMGFSKFSELSSYGKPTIGK